MQQADADPSDDNPSPSTQGASESARRRRRRTEETAIANPNSGESEDSDDGGDGETHAPSSADVMVKKMVRLALASEYSRGVIRRTDISAKVLGEQGSRQFKGVFEAAQKVLRGKFGMQMVELPGKEKVTISQRRAAQKVEKPSSSNKTWIVTSTLPPKYRTPEILPPTKAPMESSLTGLYTFIIAVILLNGGSLPEAKLERYLKRTNSDTFTPVDRTDRFLQRLCKEGYLVRNREMDGGDEVIEYMVGPRGKVEVGPQGVAGLVREVFGRQDAVDDSSDLTPAEQEKTEEFENRLARSLGIKRYQKQDEDEGGDEGGSRSTQSQRGQSRQRPADEEEEEEEESD
ncbi:hypothetical protein ASPWEDRAFT_108469 [Aspergillus wentii DTO 134E9]|uniref:MAGE domain-containing protein n=1 Tax=Aspergillus wentii DTO 134E9 TaxID=1073089 RepID=A0A1L9RNV9_ASPWE|nr:uncharacterized protein ASPWEDRAFT_108469 [Aspergillus wentii DTO 134E9]OJJ36630.1 hypothetical protein ASPWEDRAFT_108469 [Aspergillus wentii DTO 134E9]